MAQGIIAQSLGHDFKISAGEVALDGSNPTVVNTKLSTIVGVLITLKDDGASPGILASVFTYDVSGGTLNMHAWKVTSTSVTTLIADTGTNTVGWLAFGY